MKAEIEELHYLWDGTAPQWALLEVSGRPGNYLIVNIETKGAMLIDDEALASDVIKRMQDAGVRVVRRGDGM